MAALACACRLLSVEAGRSAGFTTRLQFTPGYSTHQARGAIRHPPPPRRPCHSTVSGAVTTRPPARACRASISCTDLRKDSCVVGGGRTRGGGGGGGCGGGHYARTHASTAMSTAVHARNNQTHVHATTHTPGTFGSPRPTTTPGNMLRPGQRPRAPLQRQRPRPLAWPAMPRTQPATHQRRRTRSVPNSTSLLCASARTPRGPHATGGKPFRLPPGGLVRTCAGPCACVRACKRCAGLYLAHLPTVVPAAS
jgi:hypothetical protein